MRITVARAKVLFWGLGLGMLAHALVLGGGRAVRAWGEAKASPEVEFRVQPVESALKVERHGSRHLAKGFLVVLDEGMSEEWKCLVKIRRSSGQGPEVVKKIKRLNQGRPWRAMVGLNAEESPIPFPRVSRVVKILKAEATAYDPGPVDSRRGYVGTTSLGLRAHFGIVAVDPRVIPYRSRLYVEGYGVGLAADTGGAIKGTRVDLCFNSTRQARLWGRRRVKVYLLEALKRRDAEGALKRLGLKRD